MNPGRNLEDLALKGAGFDNAETEEHMRQMWAGQSNVLVAVRVRPIMKHDLVKRSCARVLDSKVVVILDPAANDKADILRANRSREKQYAFDYVFEPGSSQDSVYHHTTKVSSGSGAFWLCTCSPARLGPPRPILASVLGRGETQARHS